MGRFFFKYTGHSQLHVRHEGVDAFCFEFLVEYNYSSFLSTMEMSNQDDTFGNTDM